MAFIIKEPQKIKLESKKGLLSAQERKIPNKGDVDCTIVSIEEK